MQSGLEKARQLKVPWGSWAVASKTQSLTSACTVHTDWLELSNRGGHSNWLLSHRNCSPRGSTTWPLEPPLWSETKIKIKTNTARRMHLTKKQPLCSWGPTWHCGLGWWRSWRRGRRGGTATRLKRGLQAPQALTFMPSPSSQLDESAIIEKHNAKYDERWQRRWRGEEF